MTVSPGGISTGEAGVADSVLASLDPSGGLGDRLCSGRTGGHGGRLGGAPRDFCQDVLAGDAAAGAAAGDGGKVDAVLRGESSDGGRVAAAGVGAGLGVGPGGGGRCGPSPFDRPFDSAQESLRMDGKGQASGAGVKRRLAGRRGRCRLGGDGGSGGGFADGGDLGEGRADGHGLALLRKHGREGAGEGGGDLDGDLLGLDFDDGVVERDGAAGGDEPAQDRALRDGLSQLRHGQGGHGDSSAAVAQGEGVSTALRRGSG